MYCTLSLGNQLDSLPSSLPMVIMSCRRETCRTETDESLLVTARTMTVLKTAAASNTARATGTALTFVLCISMHDYEEFSSELVPKNASARCSRS